MDEDEPKVPTEGDETPELPETEETDTEEAGE